METDTDQSGKAPKNTPKRNSKGQFTKGTKPTNGFNKNPQNIAEGGYWKKKKDGKAAIIDIFSLSISDFRKLSRRPIAEKSVLDGVLCAKFNKALAGNSRDAEYLINQAYGEPKRLEEASIQHKVKESQPQSPFKDLTKEDILKLLKRSK